MIWVAYIEADDKVYSVHIEAEDYTAAVNITKGTNTKIMGRLDEVVEIPEEEGNLIINNLLK